MLPVAGGQKRSDFFFAGHFALRRVFLGQRHIQRRIGRIGGQMLPRRQPYAQRPQRVEVAPYRARTQSPFAQIVKKFSKFIRIENGEVRFCLGLLAYPPQKMAQLGLITFVRGSQSLNSPSVYRVGTDFDKPFAQSPMAAHLGL